MAKTWVRIAPNIVAEAEYDETSYALGDEELEAKLTGRLRMTRKAVLEGMYDDHVSDERQEAGPRHV